MESMASMVIPVPEFRDTINECYGSMGCLLFKQGLQN